MPASTGGIIWAPQVIEDAQAHGLVLGENGRLYDSKKWQTLPDDVQQMPLLSDAQLQDYPEPTTADVVPDYVARYLDLLALADKQPAAVIGPEAKLRDRPGFEVDFISRHSLSNNPYVVDQPEVLMPVRGHWVVQSGSEEEILNPGDTCLVAAGTPRSIRPAMTGECSMYRVRGTDDAAGATMPR